MNKIFQSLGQSLEKVQPSKKASKDAFPRPLFLKFSVKEQVLFTKRLAVLIGAGVPILNALRIMRGQTASKGAKYIITRLLNEMERGQFLSASLKQFENIFGVFAVNIIQVGEISGTLHNNLEYLSEELKKKMELRRKITSAFIYPALIVVATLGITILLTGYVFPQIIPIFSSFKTELPWSTKVLIVVSNVISHDWMYILLGIFVFVVGTILLLRLPKPKLWFHKKILKIPLIGTMLKDYYLANFCRTLGLLLKSDVKIIEAIRITAKTSTNLAYKNQLNTMSEHALKGERISEYLSKHPNLFPSILTEMIIVGEEVGNLSGSLLYLSAMYEDELSDLSKNLSTVIEPVLMIFMGLIVGFVAISIIAPIYGITQNLHQ